MDHDLGLTNMAARGGRILWLLLLRIPELLLAGLLAVLVVFMSVSVFSRYALNIGLAWSDEAARLLFIWVVFVGFAVGVRHRGHIAISWIVDRFSRPRRHAVMIAQDLAVLLFSLIFTWQAVVTFRFSLLQRLPALRISIAWLYGAVVVAGILMTIYAAANLLETRRGRNVRADSAGESGMQHAE